MTWEEKLVVCQSLGELHLCMRKPGDWYVSQPRVGIATGGMLVGKYGNGQTPEAAANNHWLKLTELKGDERVCIEDHEGNHRYVRWTGYMWKDWIV